jgi:hypothetical protein
MMAKPSKSGDDSRLSVKKHDRVGINSILSARYLVRRTNSIQFNAKAIS